MISGALANDSLEKAGEFSCLFCLEFDGYVSVASRAMTVMTGTQGGRGSQSVFGQNHAPSTQ